MGHRVPEEDSPVGEEGTSTTQAEEAVAHQHGAVITHIPVLCDVLVIHNQRQPVGQSLHSQAEVFHETHPASKVASSAVDCDQQIMLCHLTPCFAEDVALDSLRLVSLGELSSGEQIYLEQVLDHVNADEG